MNMYVCKDNSDFPESLTKGKAYNLHEKFGYAGYLSLIEDDNDDVRLYPSAIFVEDKDMKSSYDFSDAVRGPIITK